MSYNSCPETYDGHHSRSDTQGRCLYCKAKFEAAQPVPKPQADQTTELGDWYQCFYDPDFNGDRPKRHFDHDMEGLRP